MTAYENCWLVRTDPADVARVESKTVISTPNQRDTVPVVKPGVKGTLGIWMSPEDLKKAFAERYPGCMKGRTMYVIPFSMGPVGGPISKIGIELTDSLYVVLCMRIMTRMGKPVLDILKNNDGEFIKALHSIGLPKPESRKFDVLTFHFFPSFSRWWSSYMPTNIFTLQALSSTIGRATLRKPSSRIFPQTMKFAASEVVMVAIHFWAKSALPYVWVQFWLSVKVGWRSTC